MTSFMAAGRGGRPLRRESDDQIDAMFLIFLLKDISYVNCSLYQVFINMWSYASISILTSKRLRPLKLGIENALQRGGFVLGRVKEVILWKLTIKYMLDLIRNDSAKSSHFIFRLTGNY
jgi:hypothetical protein